MWVQDRFDEGRRVAERTFNDGRKVAERTFGDGQKVAERSWLDGRKVAERAYDEGRQVAGRTYLDGRRDAQHRLEQARREAERRLEDGRHFLAPRLDSGRKAIGKSRKMIRDRFGDRAPAVEAGVVAGAVLWPALLLAAGAGVAYFCWSQYKRGRADSLDRSLDEPGGAGPHIAKPELVMAHNAAPKPQGHEAVDPSDVDLVEPVEDLMMHGPLDDAPPEGSSLNAMKAAARPAVLKRRPAKATSEAKALAAAATAAQTSRPTGLDESLAVQGAASASKRNSPNGATPPSSTPKRKGPTVM